jgi:hypothetical protein
MFIDEAACACTILIMFSINECNKMFFKSFRTKALCDISSMGLYYRTFKCILLTRQVSKTGTSVTFSLDFGQDIIG